MARVTKALAGRKNIKRFLKKQVATMALGADLSKQLNKQILNHFNMHLGTGKQKKKL